MGRAFRQRFFKEIGGKFRFRATLGGYGGDAPRFAEEENLFGGGLKGGLIVKLRAEKRNLFDVDRYCFADFCSLLLEATFFYFLFFLSDGVCFLLFQPVHSSVSDLAFAYSYPGSFY